MLSVFWSSRFFIIPMRSSNDCCMRDICCWRSCICVCSCTMSLFTAQAGVKPSQRQAMANAVECLSFIVAFLRCRKYDACRPEWNRLSVYRIARIEWYQRPRWGGHPHPPRPNHKSDILLLIHEVPAPILLPALLIRFSAERLFFAVADRLNAISADAGLHQCIAHPSCTAVAQGPVVFG